MTQEKWESEKGGLCCFSGEDYHDTCGSCYPTAIAPGVVVWREGPLKLSECRGTSYRLAVVFWVLPPLLILIAHIYGCRSHSSANLTCSYFFYFPFNVEQPQKKHMWVGCCVQWLSLPMSSEFLFWPLCVMHDGTKYTGEDGTIHSEEQGTSVKHRNRFWIQHCSSKDFAFVPYFPIDLGDRFSTQHGGLLFKC